VTTRQEVFDRICTHLLTQGQKTPNNAYVAGALKSPIGSLIKDEDYKPGFEAADLGGDEEVDRKLRDAISINLFWDGKKKEIPAIDEEYLILIAGLEDIHDRVPPEKWGARLATYAIVYGFNPAVLA